MTSWDLVTVALLSGSPERLGIKACHALANTQHWNVSSKRSESRSVTGITRKIFLGLDSTVPYVGLAIVTS
jgi:hypothetical protein